MPFFYILAILIIWLVFGTGGAILQLLTGILPVITHFFPIYVVAKVLIFQVMITLIVEKDISLSIICSLLDLGQSWLFYQILCVTLEYYEADVGIFDELLASLVYIFVGTIGLISYIVGDACTIARIFKITDDVEGPITTQIFIWTVYFLICIMGWMLIHL